MHTRGNSDSFEGPLTSHTLYFLVGLTVAKVILSIYSAESDRQSVPDASINTPFSSQLLFIFIFNFRYSSKCSIFWDYSISSIKICRLVSWGSSILQTSRLLQKHWDSVRIPHRVSPRQRSIFNFPHTFTLTLCFQLIEGDQDVPRNLSAQFQKYPAPLDIPQFDASVSQPLKDLYIADFEMARLKEIKDASLLRFYLKLEKYLPDALMGFADQGVKAIVLPPSDCIDL